MPSHAQIKRVYSNEVLNAMAAAFDVAWTTLAKEFGDNERARVKLARLIFRHVDRGESDAEQLARLALLDFRK